VIFGREERKLQEDEMRVTSRHEEFLESLSSKFQNFNNPSSSIVFRVHNDNEDQLKER